MNSRPLTFPQLQPLLREILRDNMDGLTLVQLMTQLARKVPDRKMDIDNVRKVLKKMPDTYIDRHTRECVRTGRYEAVWCVVVPPPDCPSPGTVAQRYHERRSAMRI